MGKRAKRKAARIKKLSERSRIGDSGEEPAAGNQGADDDQPGPGHPEPASIRVFGSVSPCLPTAISAAMEGLDVKLPGPKARVVASSSRWAVVPDVAGVIAKPKDEIELAPVAMIGFLILALIGLILWAAGV